MSFKKWTALTILILLTSVPLVSAQNPVKVTTTPLPFDPGPVITPAQLLKINSYLKNGTKGVIRAPLGSMLGVVTSSVLDVSEVEIGTVDGKYAFNRIEVTPRDYVVDAVTPEGVYMFHFVSDLKMLNAVFVPKGKNPEAMDLKAAKTRTIYQDALKAWAKAIDDTPEIDEYLLTHEKPVAPKLSTAPKATVPPKGK